MKSFLEHLGICKPQIAGQPTIPGGDLKRPEHEADVTVTCDFISV